MRVEGGPGAHGCQAVHRATEVIGRGLLLHWFNRLGERVMVDRFSSTLEDEARRRAVGEQSAHIVDDAALCTAYATARV